MVIHFPLLPLQQFIRAYKYRFIIRQRKVYPTARWLCTKGSVIRPFHVPLGFRQDDMQRMRFSGAPQACLQGCAQTYLAKPMRIRCSAVAPRWRAAPQTSDRQRHERVPLLSRSLRQTAASKLSGPACPSPSRRDLG